MRVAFPAARERLCNPDGKFPESDLIYQVDGIELFN
jgi:hypothetical protein